MKLKPDEGQIKVAMLRIGGIGDALQLAAQAKAVKRKYPNAYTMLFVRDMECLEIIGSHPAVDRAIMIGFVKWDEGLKAIKSKDYDLIYDNRYITKVIYKEGFLVEDRKKTDAIFEKYEFDYNHFPDSSNAIGKLGKQSIDLMFDTAGLEGSEEDLYIELDFDDTHLAKLMAGEKYITVHNGADVARQTKCYPTKKWDGVCAYLKDNGYKVIQLGKAGEEPIAHCIDMRGRTSIKQACALIAGAELHVDTEGGLVHIARAMRTRCVTIFGPTPESFFGYSCNVSVVTDKECRGCWWKNEMWWRECPEGFPQPVPCMDGISTDDVVVAIIHTLKLPKLEGSYNPIEFNEEFALELPLNEGHYAGEAHQWDRIYTMMSKVKGDKVLEVGAGDGYCVEVLKKQGKDVTALDISQIRVDRMTQKGIDAVLGDVNKLPFEDKTFDTVICGEVLEHIDSMAGGLKELERVCKDDGRIILSLPVAPLYDKIKMHKWGIRLHEILRDGKMDLVVLELERVNRE